MKKALVKLITASKIWSFVTLGLSIGLFATKDPVNGLAVLQYSLFAIGVKTVLGEVTKSKE